jgi:hypothetical protein
MVGAEGTVDLPVSSPSGGRSPKWRRQVGEGPGHGEPGGHRRKVEWTTQVDRSDVVRPAMLQDPRGLFCVMLRAEAAATRGRATAPFPAVG